MSEDDIAEELPEIIYGTSEIKKQSYVNSNEITEFNKIVKEQNEIYLSKRRVDFQELILKNYVFPYHFAPNIIGAKLIFEKNPEIWNIKHLLTNYRCENTLTIIGSELKNDQEFTIISYFDDKPAKKYKIRVIINYDTALLQAYLPIEEEFKLWKEVTFPFSEDTIQIIVQEITNNEVVININGLKMNLLMEMPFYNNTYYVISIGNNFKISNVKLEIDNSRYYEPMPANCSSECFLI